MKELGAVVVSVFFFVFIALFFPVLQDASVNAVSSGNYTGAEASIIGHLPVIVLVLSVLAVVVVLLWEMKD